LLTSIDERGVTQRRIQEWPEDEIGELIKPLPIDWASPALRAAAKALDEAHERLKAAKTRFVVDDLKVAEWRDNNPEPLNGRARKRWVRKWREYQDATEGESWKAQLEAEENFRDAQMVVAKIDARDMDELTLKACLSGVYDKVQLACGSNAVIATPSRSTSLACKRRRPSARAAPAANQAPTVSRRRVFLAHSTSRITLRRFVRSSACTTSFLSSSISKRSTVRIESYGPGSINSLRMRLPSSMARMSMRMSWSGSGLFISVCNFPDAANLPNWRTDHWQSNQRCRHFHPAIRVVGRTHSSVCGTLFHNVAKLMTLLKPFNGVGHVLPVQHGN
jgi:hypothetical protein